MINFSKETREGENKLVSMIDKHLRYLMLYHTFDKIINEVSSLDKSLTVDKSSYSAKTRLNIGSVLDLELSMQFFAQKPDQDDSNDSNNNTELIKPQIFKQLLQSIIENTNSATVMKNLGFLLANKYLDQVLQSILDDKAKQGAFRNASTSVSSLKWQKKVDAYKSITFTLYKESDLFFASIKNQKWSQS